MKYFSLLIMFIFLFSCATNKVPVWVKEFGKKNFSKDGIEGIGFAKFNKKDKSTIHNARQTAYNEAIKNLAIKLKTHIKGTIEYKIQDKILLVDKNFQKQASDQIESLTNLMFETVLGRKYFEEYIDNKNSLYWVYVWTTKAELQKSIQEELEKQELENISIMKYCLQNLRSVDELILSGNLILAVSRIEKVLSQLDNIKGVYVLEEIDNISLKFNTENNLNKILSSINFLPLNFSTIETIKNKPVSLDISVKIELNYNNKKIPIINFPLVCNFLEGSGECEKIKYTNSEGIAKFKVYKLTSKENLLEIIPDVETLKKYVNKTDIFSNLRVLYNIIAKSEKETKKFVIKISNLEEYKNEVIKNEIISLLRNFDFSFVDDIKKGDYILLVYVNIEYIGDKITLPNGSNKTFAETFSGSVSVELKDLINNNILLSKSFVGIKGFGNTKKEAEQNTLKKLAEVVCDYIIKNFD